MKFTVYRSGLLRQWRWRLRASNGRIIADSGESYWRKRDCLHGVQLVMDSATAAVEIKE